MRNISITLLLSSTLLFSFGQSPYTAIPQSDMDTTPFNHFVTLNGEYDYSLQYDELKYNPRSYNVNLKYALAYNFCKTNYLGPIINLGTFIQNGRNTLFYKRELKTGFGIAYFKIIPSYNHNNEIIFGIDFIRFHEFSHLESNNYINNYKQPGVSSSLSIGLNFEMKKINIAPIISCDFIYKDKVKYPPDEKTFNFKFGVLMEL